MTRKRLANHPALEAVQHQTNPILFKSLALEFNQILQLNQPSVKDVGELRIADIILEHTGMYVGWQVEPYHGYNAFVITPQIHRDHTLLRDWVKEYRTNDDAIRELARLKKNRLTGFVDRKTGRVSGIFSKFTAIIGVNLGMFYSYQDFRLTGEEIAAAVLHEVGHLFGWYELLANQLTTNQALRAAKESFLKTNDRKLRIDILSAMESALDIKIEDKDSAAEIANSEQAYVAVVLKGVSQQTPSELGSSLYDRRGFEYLADQYAVRMGAGVHLATFMDKTFRLYGHNSYRSYVSHLVAQLSGTVGFLLGSAFTLGMLPLLMLMSDDPILSGETDSYDRAGERFARMRRELLDALKRKDLPKEIKQQYLNDIETIKKIESTITDRWWWWASIYGFIFPSARKARNKIAQQQLLEDLANNSLYASSAKLSTLV